MNKKSRVILILLVLIMVILVGGCEKKKEDVTKENKEKTTIKIAYLPLTHALTLFEEADVLKENADSSLEIELVKFGSWPELLDALNSNRVDGASVLIELAMKAKAQGVGLKAVALGHRDGNVIIVANDINSASDLKGKKFAIPHRLSSHNILLNDMLVANGMSIEDIEIVELPPAEMPSALAAGQISGYCVAEPFGAKAVSMKIGKVLYQSEELWTDSVCCGVVLTDEFISNHGEEAKVFAKEYQEAGENFTPEKQKTAAINYLGQDAEVVDLSLKWISFQNLEITKDAYNVLVDKMAAYKISDKAPKYEDFIYQP